MLKRLDTKSGKRIYRQWRFQKRVSSSEGSKPKRSVMAHWQTGRSFDLLPLSYGSSSWHDHEILCFVRAELKKKETNVEASDTACETVLLATAKSPEDSFLQKTLLQRAGGCQIDNEDVCEHCILKVMFSAVKPNTTRNDNRMAVSHLDAQDKRKHDATKGQQQERVAAAPNRRRTSSITRKGDCYQWTVKGSCTRCRLQLETRSIEKWSRKKGPAKEKTN